MATTVMRHGGRRLILLGILGLILLGILGREATSSRSVRGQPSAEQFVGRVSDSDAFIGVVTDGRQVIAYVCDGSGDGLNTTSWAWFRGAISGTQTELRDDNGNTLLIELVDGAARGHVRLVSGLDAAFSTEVAAGDAGLFRAEGKVGAIEFVGGWIVLNDLQVRGALRIAGIMADPMMLASPFLAQSNLMTGSTSLTVNALNTSITAPRLGVMAEPM